MFPELLIIFTLLLTLLPAVTATVYAQWYLPRHIANWRWLLLIRLVLIAAGLGSGYAIALTYPAGNVPGPIFWLLGFGAVHVPVACILFLKHRRGEGEHQ